MTLIYVKSFTKLLIFRAILSKNCKSSTHFPDLKYLIVIFVAYYAVTAIGF